MKQRWHFSTLWLAILTGLFLGMIARFFFPSVVLESFNKGYVIPLGSIFLKLIFMMILPVITSSLILSITGFDNLHTLKNIGFKTIFYAAFFTTSTVFIGLGLITLFKPGLSISEDSRNKLLSDFPLQIDTPQQSTSTWLESLVNLIPKNPFESFVNAFNGELIPIIIFACTIGIGLLFIPIEKRRLLQEWIEAIYELSLALIRHIMKIAPVSVGCFIFATVSTLGWDLLKALSSFCLVIILSMIAQTLFVYLPSIKWIGRISPIHFFRDIQNLLLMAFATSSSSAVLPSAIDLVTEKLKVKKKISQFVLTIGAASNHNGTALYEGLSVLFLAELFGVSLSWTQQLYLMFITIISSFGTAGAPGASIPIIAMMLVQTGINPAALGILLGIDRILDMLRTTLNILGDIVTTICVNSGETKHENH